MDKRVYGILGISSVMANWNADFSGYPRTTSDGSIFGSDKALKYPMKKMWESEGEKVLYIKSLDKVVEKNKRVILRSKKLEERYGQIFETDIKKCGMDEIITNLFKAIDVKNFGAAFASRGNNVSITGAVQIGQGFNKYDDAISEVMTILSPFINEASDTKKDGKSKLDNIDDDIEDKEGEGKKQSSNGTKIITNEAHYFYPFAINPSAYNEYVELGVTDGYTQEDYDKFKAAATTAATSYATNSKIGCENELAVFVETKSDVYLPNLSEYVVFEKGERNVITLTCDELLNEIGDGILGVEIYYNPYKDEVRHNIKCAKHYNIFTKKEV